jgi:predicted amidohydrolase YtcJ
MLIYNARIYTLDSDLLKASAMLIQGERILAVGEEQEMRSEFHGMYSLTRGDEIDMGSKVVLPGLIDSHIHLEKYALGLQKVNCETTTRAECLERVAMRARETTPGAWILGHGWNQNDWQEGYGSVVELDQAAPQNPVLLSARSLHTSWTNSMGLRLANLSAATPDPPGGKLGRLADGEPNGILFESAANLVESVIPKPTPDETVQAVDAAQSTLWKMGLTGIHDFDRRDCFLALQTLHQRGGLQLRVLKSIPQEDLPHALALGLRSGLGDDILNIGGVKLFSDGALGPHTAAMIAPYQGEPENAGMLFLDAEKLFEIGNQAVEGGISLAVHAIGDRANREVLKGFQQLRSYEDSLRINRASLLHPDKNSVSDQKLRHRIEHVQIIDPQDSGKLAELGIIASMQPIHAISDMNMADRFWGKRSAYSYAWKTLLEQGAVLAFGSDAPVESPNPFWGLHAAVTRRRPDGSPGLEGWHPEQRLTVEQALLAYTVGAAYAAGWENRLGKLAPGYLADLIVLEVDPFTCPPNELRTIQPTATMVRGEWVYWL